MVVIPQIFQICASSGIRRSIVITSSSLFCRAEGFPLCTTSGQPEVFTFSHFYIFKNHDIVWELVLSSSINDCIKLKFKKLTSPSLQSQQPHFKQSSCQYISRAWKEDLWYIWRRSLIHLEEVFDTSKAPTTMYSFHLRWWWLWRCSWLWSPFNI